MTGTSVNTEHISGDEIKLWYRNYDIIISNYDIGKATQYKK